MKPEARHNVDTGYGGKNAEHAPMRPDQYRRYHQEDHFQNRHHQGHLWFSHRVERRRPATDQCVEKVGGRNDIK